jgi:hypothetical protein
MSPVPAIASVAGCEGVASAEGTEVEGSAPSAAGSVVTAAGSATAVREDGAVEVGGNAGAGVDEDRAAFEVV